MKNIYDVISKEKLDVVSNTIEKAHGLPNECYLDGEYTKIERKKLFEDKWVVIGVASSLLNPGDAKPFDLLGIPLIILRDNKNKIRVFHNVCSHRGYKLLQKPCNIKNILRCPYHSWSYNFDGKLVATPHLGGMNKHDSDDFSKESNGLKEVRTSVWLDMIIVNISNERNYHCFIDLDWCKYYIQRGCSFAECLFHGPNTNESPILQTSRTYR